MQPVDYSIGLLPWIFLGGGVLVGFVAVLRLKAKTNGVLEPQAVADLALVRTDLEAQRDEYLARLAGRDVERVNQEDRDLLRLQTARVLQQLDALPSVESPTTPQDLPPASTQQEKGFWAQRPALTGALLGGGIVGLVATLIAIAMLEATPEDQMRPPSAGSAAPSSSENPSTMPGSANQPPLPPFLQQQVDQMLADLEERPEDIATRRRLAMTLLSADRTFDAYQQANIVLQTAPKDAEALYITGFVRYLMGQPKEAIALLEQAIGEQPEYSQAWLVKGLIELQLDQRSTAVATWERGLAASGGSEPRLEHLIREAKTSKTVEEILASPPPN